MILDIIGILVALPASMVAAVMAAMCALDVAGLLAHLATGRQHDWDDSAPAGGAGAGGGSRDWTRTNNRPITRLCWSDGVGSSRVAGPLRRAA